MPRKVAVPRKKKAAVAPTTPAVAKPRRPRQRKPQVRVPPVAMAMPWLTRGDVTVSYVCPMCRARREVTPVQAQRFTSLKHVPLDELACGPDCRERWWNALIAAIQATGQQYVLRDLEWVWELQQGVVAERLAEVLQHAVQGGQAQKEFPWLTRN
jgi:hypothetical protein